jgi:hypothetical protein
VLLPGWSCLWVRVSAQVFNTRADYEALAAAVLQLRNEEKQQQQQQARL